MESLTEITCFRLKGISMYPLLRQGDIGIVRSIPPYRIKRGELIVYKRDGRIICHRVIKKEIKADQLYFLTKADFSLYPDEPVSEKEVIGRLEALHRDDSLVDLNEAKYKLLGTLFMIGGGLWLSFYEILRELAKRLWKSKTYRSLMKRLSKGRIEYRLANFKDYFEIEKFYKRYCIQISNNSFKEGFYFLAQKKSKILGILFLTHLANNKPYTGWWIFSLVVNRFFRGAGIGETLVKKAIEFVKEKKGRSICLTVNKQNFPAIRLYEKVGFRKEDVNFFKERIFFRYRIKRI